MKRFKMIMAANWPQGIIGVNGEIPWRVPGDMKHFKETTSGHIVIMGRKTWESLGKYAPLKNRINVVLTTNKDYVAEGATVLVCESAEEALANTIDFVNKQEPSLTAFIMGGGEIYNIFMEIVSEIIFTKIYTDVILAQPHQRKNIVFAPGIPLVEFSTSAEDAVTDEASGIEWQVLTLTRHEELLVNLHT